MAQIDSVEVANLKANPLLRKPTENSIDAMAVSFAAIGQLSPVGAFQHKDGFKLIYGNTRYLAAVKLKPIVLGQTLKIQTRFMFMKNGNQQRR